MQSALPLKECWAKTFIDHKGKKQMGRSVYEHCYIVGKVADSLLNRISTPFRELFPSGAPFLAALHDIGKVSPTFQEKIRRGLGKGYVPNSLEELKEIDPDIERNWGGHAGVSRCFVEKSSKRKILGDVVGQHHGYLAGSGQKEGDECFGGMSWEKRREELADLLRFVLKQDFPEITKPLEGKVLSGLTTVADWIGSGALFDDPEKEIHQGIIEEALDEAGFVFSKVKQGLSFKDIFENTPRPAQIGLIESCRGQGVYILEAPMGIGKTEAALYAAYKVLSMGEAIGIYFALPTQLTSEKIYERVNAFLRKVVEKPCTRAILVHSNAHLKMSEMGEDGAPGGSWFQSSKRGVLAPFSVGTIDQVLMAVMNVKHGFVRTFGLVGKVVILDEVHSYDAYTGTIMDSLIQALQALKCTVIILSATLTMERRGKLLGLEPQKTAYPLISSLFAEEFEEFSIDPGPEYTVDIVLEQDERQALQEAFSRAEGGQQVLWIENTVADAQRIYQLLSAGNEGGEVAIGLLHSRFLKCDRQRIEEEWVAIFGREGASQRSQRGRVLVGTQILEQSLDIDADFLVTRICPTDLLLQRLGRLWRHLSTKRPQGARRESWILSPSLEDALIDYKKAFAKTHHVYDPYILLRSVELFRGMKKITLPTSIRSLIEATYIEREEDLIWRRLKKETEKKRDDLQRKALEGLSQFVSKQTDTKITTRNSEIEGVDVLLVKDVIVSEDKTDVVFLSGETIALPRVVNKKSLKTKELSISLLENSVKIAEYLAPAPVASASISWLKGYAYLGSDDESLLRVAKVLASGEIVLLDGARGVHESKTLKYLRKLGYVAAEKEG